MTLRPAVLDADVSVLHKALLAQALREGRKRKVAARAEREDADHRQRRLPRPHHHRPSSRAPEPCNESAVSFDHLIGADCRWRSESA
jgi:hypothetical protein